MTTSRTPAQSPPPSPSQTPAPPEPGMTMRGFLVRLALSALIDLADFTLGRGLFVIPWEEGVGALILAALWGWGALFYLLELADITEQFDGFVPTATMIGLVTGWRKGMFPRRRAR